MQIDLFETAAKEKKKLPVASLDELFASVKTYRTSKHYMGLMRFVAKLPQYSPFNCFLLHTQNPAVSYVATAGQWHKRFGRTIKENARPLVILAPMSPVLFVFDVADTEGNPLPDNLLNPFQTEGKLPSKVWHHTTENLPRDRILLKEVAMNKTQAGCIGKAPKEVFVKCGDETVRAEYCMQVNSTMDFGAKYATLIHELGHLYCGHIGTPNQKWWPDRQNLTLPQVEFEAESVAWLICERAGIKNPSAAYLNGYTGANKEIPEISLDRVLKVAGQIEEMGKQNLKPRKTESKRT